MNTRNKILLTSFVLVMVLSFFIGASDTFASTLVCNRGNCFYSVCSQDSDCGSSGFHGAQTCTNNSVYQNYKSNNCINPGTQNAYCISSSNPQFQKNCGSSQTCSYGICVGDAPKNTQTTPPVYYNPAPTPSTAPTTFIRHYRTDCYSGNLYWFNSQGSVDELQKSCVDANSCTIDTCQDAACKNTLRCDGSTCAVNSADYQTHCASAANQNQTTSLPQINIQLPQAQVQGISITITGKKESDSKYAKEFSIANAGKINFLVAVKNVSNLPIENVVVKIDSDAVITYDQVVKIDNIESTSNAVSGISLGTLPAGISKEIVFSGSIKPETLVGSVKVASTVNYQNLSNTDMVTVSLLGQVKNNFAASLGSSGFILFLKGWWPWVLAAVVLIVLFFVIYKRISNEA